MDCLQIEVLHDLVDGELGKSQAAQAIAHIKSCPKCRQEFAEILTLYEGLRAVVAEDACPPKATLETYADDTLAADAKAAVEKHIELCVACRSHVWLCKASEPELAQWQAEEEQAHRQYEAETLGREAAQETLANLLPVGLEFWDRMWDSARQLVLDLRAKAPKQWPTFGAPGQLAGAIGFAGDSDPETTGTSIILVTTLLVAQRIVDGEIEANADSIGPAVGEAAQAFGAGKELHKRLVETVPPILLRFYGPSDARADI